MFWRAFSEGERAQEVGESRTADLTRGRTVVEVCEAETTGGLRQDSARYCTAGTEAKGGRQPLSARDMDMGMGTRRMLCLQWLQLSDLSADGILAPSHREV